MENSLSTDKKKSDRKYWLFALRIAGDFGITIALPVVIFAYVGKRLDARFDTAPWLLIAGFVLAAVISGAVIYRKSKRYGKEFQNLQ
jgi:predicted permease